MTTTKLDDILDFAIEKEQEAHDFYADLAERAERPGMNELFTQFAQEELGHRRKLEGMKRGEFSLQPGKKVMDLKIADYLVEVPASASLTYQNALILAMQREKAAFRLYTDLAAATEEEQAKLAFQALAQEEAKHKLRFEVEYDDMILTEN